MGDIHTVFADHHGTVIEHVPEVIERGKQLSADTTAARHTGQEVARAGVKTTSRISKSLSKMLNSFAEDGIAGILF